MGDCLEELRWRGMVHQVTSDALAGHLSTPGRVAYAGFDPTSDSLTVGNFAVIQLLAHLQRAGHRVIVLMGGGTGLIGDPSGKSAERQLLSRDQVRANVQSQRRIFERVIDFGAKGTTAALQLDNADWLVELRYLEVLREVGKHFSVNQMIARDSVAARLEGREQGISYTEFSYMVLQAYDFLYLNRAHGCTLQVGGADQWGNIVSGIDLIRRAGGADSFGLTCPLVTKRDGTKFGKTESGAIWLTADRTSPYRFHQFWLQAADADVGPFLRWFTFLDRARIEALEAEASAKPQERAAQKALADEVTEAFHGPTERDRARQAGQALFSGAVRGLDERQVADICADLPQAAVESSAFAGEGMPLVDALTRAGLAQSKREAREFVAAKAVSVNGEPGEGNLTAAQLLHGRYALLRRGKKQWAALVVAR